MDSLLFPQGYSEQETQALAFARPVGDNSPPLAHFPARATVVLPPTVHLIRGRFTGLMVSAVTGG